MIDPRIVSSVLSAILPGPHINYICITLTSLKLIVSDTKFKKKLSGDEEFF